MLTAEQPAESQRNTADQFAQQGTPLTEHCRQIAERIAEQHSRLQSQLTEQRLENQARTRYLARDKGLSLAKCVLDQVISAATSVLLPGSRRSQLKALFSKDDSRAQVMDAVHLCPGWEIMSSADFLRLSANVSPDSASPARCSLNDGTI